MKGTKGLLEAATGCKHLRRDKDSPWGLLVALAGS